MKKSDLRLLVVGGGSAGVRHFRYSQEYGVQCSVCDPADSCRVTNEFPDAEHLRDFDSVDLSDFDAVTLCTPPYLHVPQATAAVRAGCHVLLEKPIAVTEEGLDELEQVVAEKDLVGAVSFPYSNMPAMDRLIEIVQSGEIGDLWMTAYHKGENLLKFRPDFYSTYYVSDEMGGGCLQDDANHALTAIELLCGDVEEITCQRHSIGIKDVDADDTCFVWLKFKSGVISTLDWSNQCHLGHSNWIISGSKGGIRFTVNDMQLEIFDAATEETRAESFDDDWNESFRRNDQDFIDAICGTGNVRCTLQQARHHLRTVLAAKESSTTGGPVTLTRDG
jgi:predicted dehydrogenase